MIDDARIGDELAMVNDARVQVDDPRAEPPADAPMVVGGEAETPSDASMAAQVVPAPADEESEVAEGRLAAQSGQPRTANPYDGRSIRGKAWYRGYDAVEG